ncbi:sugar-phosphatase [Enterobacteriaceae bacterium LUAb1]
MTIKMIAIDLDGTLLDDQHNISNEVISAISRARENGINIVLASGRPYSGIKPYLEQLALHKPGTYCVSNNGSVIHDAANGNHLADHLLNMNDYKKIYQVTEPLALSLHALGNNQIYTANEIIGHYTVHEAYLTRTPLNYKPIENMPTDILFTKLMISSEPDKLSSMIKNIPEALFNHYTLLRSTPYFLEVLNRDANKGLAIKSLAKKLNISKNEIMCIGDQNNDLPMFNFASVCIAMGNATDELKQRATHVTLSNNENGVAIAINKYTV